jgi:hypothetical protein
VLDLTELEAAMTAIGRAHDASWDAITRSGSPGWRTDPEALYHWEAAAACEELFNRGRQMTQIERIQRAAGLR